MSPRPFYKIKESSQKKKSLFLKLLALSAEGSEEIFSSCDFDMHS